MTSFFILGFFVVFGIFSVQTNPVEAATFQMHTGTYVGDGTDDRAITGLGFQPDMVMIKDNTNVGNNGFIFKTSSMTAELTLVTAENDANLTTNHIQSLDTDGFTVGDDADVNTANIMYHYVAFSGSDCTATGTFCVGSYTGTGAAQSITSVGFQPDVVLTKRSGNRRAAWKSSAMAGTTSARLNGGADFATNGITSLDATGFTVGTRNEVGLNGVTYYYFAFKEVANFMDVGTYTGNGTDNRDITSAIDVNLTFQPDFVWTKAETNQSAVASIREHYGDRSFLFTDGNSNRNYIQDLLSTGGFQIGTNNRVNQNTTEYNYVAFAGASTRAAGTGTFEMAEGTHSGTGAAVSLTGLGFEPDLVIIKGENTQNAVFRTSLMAGDRTAHFSNANVFTGGILSLDADGFSLGTDARVNENGTDFYWTAFGNAYRMDRTGGASDFMVGQYIGTGQDDRSVRAIPIEPDLLAVKRVANTEGAWRTSSQTGDQTIYFRAVAQNANRIQNFNTDGFEKGTSNRANSSGSIYDYFIFVEGDRFDVGTYTGTGATQNITTPNFQPDFLWLKKITGGTARSGIFRSSEQTGDTALSFINLNVATGLVTDLILNGFSLGTGNESNENTFSYQYAAWNNKEYTQQSYRFFDNDDSTNVGSSLEAIDTAGTLGAAGDAFRLRLLTRVDGGNLFTSSEEFTLQFAEMVGTCDTSFTGEVYADVTTSTLIAYNNNTTPADDDTLTANVEDPTDGARTIVNQSYKEDNDVTNNVGAITQGQTGKWDFALIDNGAPEDTHYCFRLVYADTGNPIETYTVIPEITTAALVELSFSLSDTEIGFDELNSTAPRYATGNELGSDSDVVAHTFSASSTANSGYFVSIYGDTLTNPNGDTIDAIGGTATASSPGSEQFGLRVEVNSGTGTATAPFNTANWAFNDTAPQEIASGTGDNTTTVYDVRYIANKSSATEAGQYETELTYTATGQF